MSSLKCPQFDWCEFTNPEHITEDMHGIEFVAVADESSVEVRIFHGTRAGEDDWSISMDIGDWEIQTPTSAALGRELDREFTNLRSIVDQIERRVRAFHTAHVGAAVVRRYDVLGRLESLADR